MAKRSRKQNPIIVPRFVNSAVRKGLRLADTIGIDEANDKTWLTITFRKLPIKSAALAPQEGSTP